MDDFVVRALAAGIGVALVAGPLGSFIVWRRMAYFGDTLAHSALLGVALGFFIGLDINLGIVLVASVLALILVALQSQRHLANDTLLGIFSHTALSLGLIVIAMVEPLRRALFGYLFGDILSVSMGDLVWIYAGAAGIAVMLMLIWRPLLSSTVHEELARVEGVPVLSVRLVFMLLIAVLIAMGMQVIGILLTTALLIIPAAVARNFARTPEQMAGLASLIGGVAVVLGVSASWWWDSPTGPSIVVAAAALFAVSLLARRPG